MDMYLNILKFIPLFCGSFLILSCLALLFVSPDNENFNWEDIDTLAVPLGIVGFILFFIGAFEAGV